MVGERQSTKDGHAGPIRQTAGPAEERENRQGRESTFFLKRLPQESVRPFVVEHNSDLIRASDWVIDLGPEGGPAGGTVVAEGTPEEIARNERSYTGKFLRL